MRHRVLRSMARIGLVLVASIAGIACVLGVLVLLPPAPDPELMRDAQRAFEAHQPRVLKPDLLVLIDFDRIAFRKRLWVVARKSGRILASAHVAHGEKSGWFYARRFKNVVGSRTSLIGSFITGEDYWWGKWGHSLEVHGLEAENDRAWAKRIVFHRWLPFIPTGGCWGTLPWVNERIIELAKGGTFVFVGGPRN